MPDSIPPRIVIAPDSLKESCSAHDAAQAIAAGIRLARPDAVYTCIPIADGGEGTIDAILQATPGRRHRARVRRADGVPTEAEWAILDDGTAIIELASAAGLEQLPAACRNPLQTTTYGVGELMVHALDAGARRIVLALGGSATNDGGAGMLQALGVRLLDAGGTDLDPGGAALARLARIDTSGLHPRAREVNIEVAADVNNPLCGPNGASAIFGPQKGASTADVRQLDAALAHFADVARDTLKHDLRDQPGVGAAGGTGFAAVTFLGGRLRRGFDLIADLTRLEQHIRQASLVFTAEGRFDAQTSSGKAPAGVIRLARAAGVPAVVLCGALGEGYEALYDEGLTAAFSLAPGPIALEAAYARAPERLTALARDIARLYFAH